MPREYVLQPFRSGVDLRIDYARELNAQQHAAVVAPPGPSLVIAGAGSGKTRTLTYRVAYLLEQGITPDRILLLTFTNKAAKEMMRRVTDLLGREVPELWGGTFHSIANRILRLHADRLGFQRGFTILDREDARDVIKAAMGDVSIDVKATRFPKAEVLADLFGLAGNRRISVEEMLARDFDYLAHLAPQISRVHARYAQRKREANAMDFDDLLLFWLRLLTDHPDMAEHYQRRFQFILVDEYQDTNKLQGDLIDLLAARHQNVMVVGDDAQSIYAWRGADFQNILRFPERYPAARTYRIETNYRSTPEILNVANAAIAANTRQFSKRLNAVRAPGVRPVLAACGDAGEQAAFVAQRLLEMREEGGELSRMAVLYRSHFHALELQLELTRREIPFTITSGIRFFEQAHIKDVAAWLKLAVNPRDELSFKRLVEMLPGIGGRGAEKLWQVFRESAETPASGDGSRIVRGLEACRPRVPRKAVAAWEQFVATAGQVEDRREDPGGMIRIVVDAGYREHLQETFTNYRSRLEDLEQLAVFARQFETVEDFLAQLALLTNVEAEDQQTRAGNDDRVRLSTVHQAKGLEFDVVFVIMLCDGLFPSARSMESEEGEEEERRLFYVALTRARNELCLTYPLIRFTHGKDSDLIQQRSRFLGEIPPELLDEWTTRSFSPYS